jgi:hypothetical protein
MDIPFEYNFGIIKEPNENGKILSELKFKCTAI